MKNLKKYYTFVPVSEYREIRLTNNPIDRYENCLDYFVNQFKGTNVIEVGAGNGILCHNILKHNKTIELYHVTDFLNENIAILSNIKDERARTYYLDLNDFSFVHNEVYDAIILNAVIEHVINPAEVINKLKSGLKKGGIIYIDTPNIADYGCRWKLLKGIFPSTGSKNQGNTSHDNNAVTIFDGGHLHYFTWESLMFMIYKYCGMNLFVKKPYPIGKLYFGKKMHCLLAKIFPGLFSPIALIIKK